MMTQKEESKYVGVLVFILKTVYYNIVRMLACS